MRLHWQRRGATSALNLSDVYAYCMLNAILDKKTLTRRVLAADSAYMAIMNKKHEQQLRKQTANANHRNKLNR